MQYRDSNNTNPEIMCILCNKGLGKNVVSSSNNMCLYCEKRYYDALYERQDKIAEYLKAKGR